MGRPKIHLDLNEIERMAGQGLTEEQIAYNLGVHYTTLLKRKQQYSEYSEALKRGRAKAIDKVTNALYNKAVDGDTTAMIYWTKNMAKTQFKDRWDVEHSGSMEHTITVVDPGCGNVGPDAESDQS